MWELVSMWRNPKMVALAALTAGLYAALLMPLADLQALNGTVDLGRVGIAVPLVFSVLFGPAAAWGAAFGNLIRDALGSQVTAASIFGFVGNFMVGYVPYKMWRLLSADEPNVKMPRKMLTYLAASVFACVVCGLVIGLGVYWVWSIPFAEITATVMWTNSMWAVVAGSFLFLAVYGYVQKRKWQYTNILKIHTDAGKTGNLPKIAVLIMVASILACVAAGVLFDFGPVALLPFVAVMIVASAFT